MKKFRNTIDIQDWEIETPNGWADIKQVMETVLYSVWRVVFVDGTILEGADTHILIDESGNEVFIKDLKIFQKIKARDGLREVKCVYDTKHYDYLYDVEVDSEDHLYFSNDIVSHNTTTAAAYILYELLFNEEYTAAILANKADTAREILDRLKRMFEELPIYLQPGVFEWNKGRIELGNGCKALAAASSNSSIRGKSISLLYMDEMAFLQNDVEFFASTYPVVTSGKTTKVIITSTPNGMNLFYKMWIDAVEGRSKFKPIKFLWHDHPDRNEEWKNDTLGNMDKQQFSVEFECEFLGSSNTLISGVTLQRLAFVEPLHIIGEKFFVYEMPKEDHSYVACIDVSEGTGKDYSVVHIIDVTTDTFKQVALYRDNMAIPLSLAQIANGIMKKYNDALCIVETNSVGTQVFDALFYDYEYENMLTTTNKDSNSVVSTNSKAGGLRQTSKTRNLGCSMLKSLIESNTLVVQDYNTIQELSYFIKKGNRYEAEKRKNDDIVMTMVMFAWFVDQPYFKDLTDMDIRGKILENSRTDEDHGIYGFMDDGIDEESDFDPTLISPSFNEPKPTGIAQFPDFEPLEFF